MTTLLYGSVIKIISTDSDSVYDNKLFFVERLDDSELVLVSDDKNKLILPIENQSLGESIQEVILIYKPPGNFAQQNRLFPKQWVEIEMDDITVKGQIIVTDPYIEVRLEDTTIYIPTSRGLPAGIKRITKIVKPISLAYKKQNTTETNENEKENENEESTSFEQVDENEILGYMNEDIEEAGTQYFYSLEQQTTDLLENLIIYVPEDRRTPSLMKKLSKTIQRYKEIRSKYTEFSDGIYIKRLPTNQILKYTTESLNKCFLPITKDVEVYRFDVGLDETFTIPDFFHKKKDTTIPIIRKLENEMIPFNEKRTLFDEVTDNYMFHKKLTPKKSKHIPFMDEEVLIYDAETLLSTKKYSIRTNNQYIIHSFMTPPVDYMEYIKRNQHSSNIIDKSNLGRMPFYRMFYNTTQHNIRNVNASDLFINNKYIYYENQTELFETYCNKVTPSLNSYVDIGLENLFIKPFYNFYQCIKSLENVNIHELTQEEFTTLKAKIVVAVNRYKKNMKSPNELSKKEVFEYAPNTALEHAIALYKDVLPKSIVNQYYTSSELLKLIEIDNNNLFNKTFIKNSPVSDITQEEVREVKEEINSMLDSSEIKETIQRIYKTEQERENERVQPIILQDINRISGLEHIYRKLIEIFPKTNISLERTQTYIDAIVANNMKQPPKMNPDLFATMLLLINETKVVNGNTAYVEDSKKTYKWLNGNWVSIDDPRCFDKRKLVSVKGSACDMNDKESEYKERVQILLNNIIQKKGTENAVKTAEIEIDTSKASLLLMSINNKSLKHDLKYNTQKEMYSIIESQQEESGYIESPHYKIRDRILIETNLENKYKAIQLFINRFTKSGPDLYWYYCIDQSTKLMPTFFHKLANAYLITNNYDMVVEQICLEQGTLSDNGDKWVDKYSGYIIKDILFEEEDGYYDLIKTSTMPEDVEIFSEVAVEELALERFTKSCIKTLFTYVGVGMIEDNELYELIIKSYRLSIAKLKEESKQKLVLLASIIGHVFVFIQTYPKALKITNPYPSCKRSFKGYPLNIDENNTEGIKYFACIIKGLSKGAPWNEFAKLTEPMIEDNLKKYIKNYVITIFDIEQLLIKKRSMPEEVSSIKNQTIWDRFYPRLKPIHEIVVRDQQLYTISDYKDRIYYLSLLVQKEIHNHVAKQSMILTDNLSNPYLINACCNENNYTYNYFLNNTNGAIHALLKDIIVLKRTLRKLEKLVVNQKMYFIENTQKQIVYPSNAFSEETMFSGIIKWNHTNPDVLEHFGYKIPKFDKKWTLDMKIRQLKDQGIVVINETFLNMLQRVSERIMPDPIIEEDELPDDPIIKLIDTPSTFLDVLDKENNTLFAKLKKIDSAEPFLNVLNFNNTCIKNNTNLIISNKLEHYAHMNQILYNRINLLLFVFPEMLASNKMNLQNIFCEHWNLSSIHNKDITDTASAYYSPILQISKNEDIQHAIKEVSLERFKNLIKIKLHNQEMKNFLYQHILLAIFYEYKSSTTKKSRGDINTYLFSIIKIFERENRALNYDTTKIKYEVNLSKKSETQIKTDYFKSLGKDSRKAEGVLKEHKLEKWGVGLQKGMFQYVKGNYLKDKLDARAILDNITKDDSTEDVPHDIINDPFAPLDDPEEYSSNLSEEDEIDEDE
jgi:hypothetical protein